MAGATVLASSNLFAFRGSPNEKVVIASMGSNSRGFFLARMYAQLPNVEVGYVCDVDSRVVAKTTAEIEKMTGKKPKSFTDVRKMLEVKDFDALVIAAPDHWHAPAALMAVKAGKNVYVEKVLVNGKSINRNYLTHAEIMNGGKITFFMSDKPKM